MGKTELRKQLIQRRRSLSQQEWHHKNQQICQHLETFSLIQQANGILSYFSIKQEPDLSSLTAALPFKRWGFPRCVDQSLSWHLHVPDRLPLQTGAYGITEPHPDAPKLRPEQVDLILVPCVGCDRRGYRLGYGAGYYDRLFSASEWQTKVAIGVVFEFALVDEFAIDPWDKPLTGICTESGVTLFRDGQ
jgi:5-formyltetrahydrofolate cyclo-ligase